MDLNLQQEIAIATVIAVESLPCSMLGQKKILAITGEGQTGNLQLPWNLPMTWIEEQLGSLVRGKLSNGMFKVAELINPDEPDQIVKVMLDPYLSEILNKAIRAAQDETPAALATIVKSKGSTTHQVGARLLIYRDGQTHGTLGGGYAEAEVRLAALQVIDAEKPFKHQVSLSAESSEIAALEGRSGGGRLEIFIEPVKTFMWAFNSGESHELTKGYSKGPR